MPAWIVWTLIPLGLIAITVSASMARASSGRRKAIGYSIALLIGALCFGFVLMIEQGTRPGGWGATLASTGAVLLLLYLLERRFGRKTEPDIPPV